MKCLKGIEASREQLLQREARVSTRLALGESPPCCCVMLWKHTAEVKNCMHGGGYDSSDGQWAALQHPPEANTSGMVLWGQTAFTLPSCPAQYTRSLPAAVSHTPTCWSPDAVYSTESFCTAGQQQRRAQHVCDRSCTATPQTKRCMLLVQ
jgi:hypothetical protein